MDEEFKLENSNYELKKIKFNVDDVLHQNIKEPFPNVSFFWLIAGKAGSGKTNLLINSLVGPYKKVFDKILLVMPKNSRASLKNNPLDDLPDDQTFESFTPAVLAKIHDIREDFDELNKKKPRNRNQLLILDDVTAYLKDHPKELIELATNRRHLKLSIILLVQFVRSIPRPVRFQITDLCIFKPANELDTKILEEEFINMDKDKFKKLCRFVWQSPHDFLFINKNYETFYKNLNKIIF
jgi:hypothetical protein